MRKNFLIISFSLILLSALLITVHISANPVSVSEEENSRFDTEAEDKNIFSDIKETDWFYSDIAYVNEKGLMKGTNDNLFEPNIPTTRGMLVTILWRLDGEPSENNNIFSDVANDAYYYNAVSWASKCGIVNGYTESTFSPEDNITREQLAAIFYRYSLYKKYDVSEKLSLDKYTDADKISDYAVSAMQWANANGIITGTSSETLSPQDYALRCQIAAILKRFCEQFVSTSSVNEPYNMPETNNSQEDNKVISENNNSSDFSHGYGTSSSTGSKPESENNSGYPLILVDDITAKPGDEVQISVRISNNPGILGMAMTAYYDESAFTLQNVENGEAFANILDMTPSKELMSGARFMWDGIEVKDEDIKNGTILTMKFTVNSNAAAGRYPITLKYADGDIVDNNLVPIVATIEDGYITIE